MLRYPDQILIQKVVGNENDPYKTPTYDQVYKGKCRVFLHKTSTVRNNKTAECDYKIVVPDNKMPEIGENARIAVKAHNNPDNNTWNIIGYCKDFARYERVCEIYMQVIKDNIIEEDIPGTEEPED